MANLLTSIRALAAAPFACAMLEPSAEAAAWAALWLALAVVTDLLDGPLARSRGTASPGSRLFDHASDFVFVTTGLTAAALRGAVPALLPIVVVLAFARYALASTRKCGAGRQMRPDPLGRINGILYFVPLVGDIGARLGAASLAPAVRSLAWILVLTTVIAILHRTLPAAPRLRRLRLRRRAPGSPAAGMPARSSR